MTGLRATAIIARLTWARLARSTMLWLSGCALALPLLLSTAGKASWEAVFAVATLLLVILPPLHLGPAVGEEIDDKTFTYLWSRPFPRWAVVTGKLATHAPLLMIGLSVSVALPLLLIHPETDMSQLTALLRGSAGLAVGALSVGMLAVGVGSLLPRFPVAVSIAYMMAIDLVLGSTPLALRSTSITFHVRAIAGFEPDANAIVSAIAALAIGAVWLAIGLARATRVEYSTD